MNYRSTKYKYRLIIFLLKKGYNKKIETKKDACTGITEKHTKIFSILGCDKAWMCKYRYISQTDKLTSSPCTQAPQPEPWPW